MIEAERYEALGRACEANGLGWYNEDGEMRFQPPAEVIAEQARAEAQNTALFQTGNFTLASGAAATWKIECDVLTAEDWQALALMAVERLPAFGSVEGVPRGGIPFADALRPYATEGPLLIAEDVVTTGGSLERFRAGREAIGVVAFARGQPPAWVFPVFTLVKKFE